MKKNRTSKNDNSVKKTVCSKCDHKSSGPIDKPHRRCSGKKDGNLIPKGGKRLSVSKRGVWKKGE